MSSLDDPKQWQEFLTDVADVIDSVSDTDLSEPVLDRLMKTATLEMQVVFAPMTLDEGDPEQNPGVVCDHPQCPERPLIVRLAKGRNMVASTVNLAHGINREFFKSGYDPEKRKRDLIEAINLPHFFRSLAMLAHEELGDEGAAIVFACLLQNEKQEQLDTGLRDVSVFDFPEERLPGLAREFIEFKLGQWAPGGRESAVRQVMGEGAFEKISKKHGTELSQVILRFLTIAKRSAAVRHGLLEALKKRLWIGDRAMTEAIVNQGTRTLIEHTPEVTDIEWMRLLHDQHKNLDQEPEMLKQIEADPKKHERLLQAKKRIADFLANNTDPEHVRPLRELLPVEWYRTRLRELKNLHDPLGYVSLQKEIIHAVTGVVARYHTRHVSDVKEKAASVTGLPVHVVKTKEASCFSGPWIIAALLEYCGIDPERLFYCNVQRTHNGVIGGHGSIFLTTDLINASTFGEVIFVDFGYQMSGRTLPLQICDNLQMFHAVRDLFTNKTTDSVTLRYDPDTAKAFGIHNHMQVMPLSTGLSTGHLLHVGMSFLEENLLDEAEYCFELGLSFNKMDPDLLYYLGIVHFKRNDVKEAEAYLRRAIAAFPDHVQSHYSLGEVFLSSGDAKQAKEYFAAVAAQKRSKIYGDKTFFDRAVRFMGLEDDVLLAHWQEPFHQKKGENTMDAPEIELTQHANT